MRFLQWDQDLAALLLASVVRLVVSNFIARIGFSDASYRKKSVVMKTKTQQKTNITILKYLYRSNHSRYLYLLLLTLLSIILVSVGDIYQARVMMIFMNRALGLNDYSLLALVLYGLGFAVLYYGVSFLSTFLLSRLMAKVRQEIATDLLEKKLTLPIAELKEKESASSLSNLYTTEVNNLVDQYFLFVVQLFGVGVSLVLGFAYLSTLSLYFLIPILLTIVCIGAVILLSKKKIEISYNRLFSYSAALVKTLNNIASCFLLSNMFSYRRQLLSQFDRSFSTYNNQRKKAVYLDNVLEKVNGLLSLVLFLSLYLIAIVLAIHNKVDGGEIVAVTQVAGTIISPFFVIANVFRQMNSTKNTRIKIASVLQRKEEGENVDEIRKIALNNVSLSYQDRNLFHDVTMDFETGDLVLISGPSGCGKTTLLNILSKMNDEYKGRVVINDHVDLKSLTDGSYFRSLKYMPQSPIILDGSVRDNIILNESFEQDKFDKIVTLLKLDKAFHEDYETILDTEKENYSLGEARRICFARMLYTEAKFILLDEPFASLDDDNCRIIEEAILAQKDKCVILTSHVVSEEFVSHIDKTIQL